MIIDHVCLVVIPRRGLFEFGNAIPASWRGQRSIDKHVEVLQGDCRVCPG